MTDAVEIEPVSHPICGTVRPPGSKSITNRALLIAALANGRSQLTGVLDSQDTRVMIESLLRLGLNVVHDAAAKQCVVTGLGGPVKCDSADLWLENSGTSMRFLTALCTLGNGRYRLDGVERMRQRPIGDLVDSLRALGASVDYEIPDSLCPPLVVNACDGQLSGGRAEIQGGISSQFLSGLLMVAPACREAVRLDVAGTLVSPPYVTMTLRMMKSFGVSVDCPRELTRFEIQPQRYQAREYDIEPDASAASYFFGAAAITQGRITVEGLSRTGLQGDVTFVDALERMGCSVHWSQNSITVEGQPLHGIDIDMNAISDTAQTLAVVAAFADSPTTIRNVAHMRHKETDRIAAVVTELNRAGITAEEFDDGLRVFPGSAQPAEIHTYDDHRMAMSFSLLGLRSPGIRILDPGCTAKTYPNWFDDLSDVARERSDETQ
jgi:3-phosphoshikimate 1-carboxyvinyltransferase